MIKKLCRFTVLPTMLVLAQSAYTATDCGNANPQLELECEALVKLFEDTNGSGWTNNSGWNETNTVCSWYGVKECEGGHVTSLVLGDNNLDGTIPSEIGNLSHLKTLSLPLNQLRGTIPNSIGNLRDSLEALVLFGNQLSGTIPAELNQLTLLEVLLLNENQLGLPFESHNQFTGPIPCLDQLKNVNVTELYLGDNTQFGGGLTGSLDPSCLPLYLQHLELQENNLTGEIPDFRKVGDEWHAAHLSALYLGANKLSGQIPQLEEQLPSSLKHLGVSYNCLTGNIPEWVMKLDDLTLEQNCLNTDNVSPELSNWLDEKNPKWRRQCGQYWRRHCSALEARADTQIRADYFIRKNDNYGMTPWMEVGTSRNPQGEKDAMRSLIRFDLPENPSALSSLISATLELSLVGFEDDAPTTSVYKVDVHRIVDSGSLTPWIEGNGDESALIPGNDGVDSDGVDSAFGVAWGDMNDMDSDNQDQPDFDPTVIASATIDQSSNTIGDIIKWDITPLVHQWIKGTVPNFGMMLRDTTSDGSFRGVVFGTREREKYDPYDDQIKGPRLILTFRKGPGNLVNLADFKTTAEKNGIRSTWHTGAEVNNAGFHLWRGVKDEQGEYTDITLVKKLAAQGNSRNGACYSYVDTSANKDGVTYYYLLEDIDTGGKRTLHLDDIDSATAGKVKKKWKKRGDNECKD